MQSELQLPDNKKLEINAATLKPGLYFLRLQTNDKKKTISFIKQ